METSRLGLALERSQLTADLTVVTGPGAFTLTLRGDFPPVTAELDGQPVDLVFLLLAPEGAGADHLKALSRIARVLRDGETVAKVRGTSDAMIDSCSMMRMLPGV